MVCIKIEYLCAASTFFFFSFFVSVCIQPWADLASIARILMGFFLVFPPPHKDDEVRSVKLCTMLTSSSTDHYIFTPVLMTVMLFQSAVRCGILSYLQVEVRGQLMLSSS